MIRDEHCAGAVECRCVSACSTLETRPRVLSDLVRGRDGLFLDDLDDVTILDPRETALVDDPSPRDRQTRLYLESLLRQSSTGENSGTTSGEPSPILRSISRRNWRRLVRHASS